ncbi:hypothetical protein [Pseudophaeobacter sp.]|uniref:hypothetical protein n=1 Tax=Pseudophaeobacter sp. TaxID=1971739 RepID=UPI0032D991D9
MLEAKSGEFEQATGGAVEHGGKRAVGVWEILCWAFQRECASLDLGEQLTGLQSQINVDPIYRMAEIARLGCRVDGGGSSRSHHDADIVAATLAVLPDSLGGFRTATWIAELARAGREPAWRGEVSILPVETRTNRWGVRAATADAKELGASGWPHQPRQNRKGVTVYDVVDYCPCLIRPSPSEIVRMRHAYMAWQLALLEVRNALQITHLTAHVVTDRMPPRAPWAKTA